MPDPRHVKPLTAAKRDTDQAIAEMARRQHGVIARSQLLALGLTHHEIDLRRRRGRLHDLHRGVYAVGHIALTREGRWLAAVLRGGPGALLSHHPAGALWQMRRSDRVLVDVTVAENRRPCNGVRFHRTAIPPDERTVLYGIPVTTVPRTLLDLAAVLDGRRLERAINEADVLRLTDALSLRDLLVRYPRRAGTPAIAAALAARAAGATVTRSELEERFLDLLERHGLSRPRTNTYIDGIEVDCAWPAQRLIVELDGRAAHGTREAFERDRERDRLLQAAGWRVIRVTWRQVSADPAAVATDLRTLLAA